MVGHIGKPVWAVERSPAWRGAFWILADQQNPTTVQNNNTSTEDLFPFLFNKKVEEVTLSSGKKISIIKYKQYFSVWEGEPIANTYGNKAVVEFDGEAMFAELAVLKTFQKNGWEGVWVDSYRKKFRIGLPDVEDPVEIPADKKKIIDDLREATGQFGGCWDLFLWKNGTMLFVELKRFKKDKIQASQILWLEKALDLGFTSDEFMFVEWDLHDFTF